LLFRNTLAQSTTTITSMIFSVILAPIMLSRLGLAAFGVWAVTGAFATYATVFDLGITRASSRSTTRAARSESFASASGSGCSP
jgi:O-antigen/teichoic acid export membrane protein